MTRATLRVAALAGTCLAAPALAQYQWAAPSSGSWFTAANWTPLGVPNAAADTATLALTGAYSVSIPSGVELTGLTITNPAVTIDLDCGNGQSLRLGAGGLTLGGTLNINTDAGAYDTLSFSTSATIAPPAGGSGRITLNASPGDYTSALISAAGGPVTLAANITVDGVGALSGQFINRGRIAGSPNLGVLALNADITQQSGGQVFIDNSAHRFTLGPGSTISGGVVRAINGAAVQTLGSSTIAGVANQGLILVDPGNGAVTSIGAGGITSAGTITINSDAAQYDTLSFNANTSVASAITLNASLGDFNSATLTTATTATGTLLGTVAGQGVLSGNLNNNGSILGGDGFGTILTNTTFNQLASGRFNVSGANKFATISTNATVSGGLVQTSAGGVVQTFSSSTLTGSLTVTAGSDLWIQSGNGSVTTVGNPTTGGSGIINAGRITINPDAAQYDQLVLAPNASITGSGGTVILNANLGDLNSANLNTGPSGALGVGQTIRGVGVITGTSTSGATIAGGTSPGLFLTNGSMTQTATGQINVAAGDIASIAGNFTVNSGLLRTTGSGIVQTLGTSTINRCTNAGTLHIQSGNGGITNIGPSGLINNATVTINPDAAQYDTLFIPQSATINSNTGPGSIVLNANLGDLNSAAIVVDTGATLTLIGQTISGVGVLRGNYINAGTIGGGGANIGPLVLGPVTQTIGRFAPFGAGQFASIGSGGSVTGGTFDAALGAVVQTVGTCTLSGVRNTGTLHIESGNGGITTIRNNGSQPALTNDATIVVNSDQAQYDTVVVDRPGTIIDGIGAISLRANTGDFNSSAIVVNGAGSSLTLGIAQTLRGNGVASGPITIAGTLTPGRDIPGEELGLIISNATDAGAQITLQPTATTQIQLGGPSSSDRLLGNSAYALAGSLQLSYLPSAAPAGTDFFDIIVSTAALPGVTGRFAPVTVPPSVPSGPMHVVYLPDRVRVVACYANCDGSDTTALSPADFTCFLSRYRAGDPYANCDQSTGTPALSPADFTCFLNRYRAGCS